MVDITDSIRPLVRGKSFDKRFAKPLDEPFDDETLQAMSDAFDKATALMTDQSDEAIEDVAIRIIAQASLGECDPDKLAAVALAGANAGNAAS